MQNLTSAEVLLLKKILVFYMHHHMSLKNPQYNDVNQILDKIRLKVIDSSEND
tara:strand:+ start:350 stop:508 length:159 start_codon:yes stop_codon:yes gene_type:complete